jgi:hypothetical protein
VLFDKKKKKHGGDGHHAPTVDRVENQ